MSKFALPGAQKRTRVRFDNLAGVDLSGEERSISANRSPGCVNMYKKYMDGFCDFIETRPGFQKLLSLSATVYGMYFLRVGYHDQCVLHAGTRLLKWLPPSGEPQVLRDDLPQRESAGFVFGEKLYILTGTQYLCYDGYMCEQVGGTVPITTIARQPSGGGENYQAVNMLTPRRMNSFRGDGTSTMYFLDAQNIDSGSVSVTVNGISVYNFSTNVSAGCITFTTPPAAAAGGDDNVVITFSKTIAGHREKVLGCTVCRTFDNRVFLTGNDAFPNELIHSELEDPCYVPDINYYLDGEGDCAIVSLAVSDGSILAFKNQRRQGCAIFRHTPSVDYELGRIYPAQESAISLGNVTRDTALCFMDDLVYLSARGLEGVGALADQTAARALVHRSSLVDRLLLSENLAGCRMVQFNGYLCILAGSRMYLADSRALYRQDGRTEYEWFLWEGIGTYRDESFFPAEGLYPFGEYLYFTTASGDVCRFGGDTDDGRCIQSCYETRFETAGDYALRKTVRKRGASALLKTIPNSRVDVSCIRDNDPERTLCAYNMGGFDFEALDFGALSFCSGSDNVVSLPLQVKDFLRLKLRFFSDKRFGLKSIQYNVDVIDYTK